MIKTSEKAFETVIENALLKGGYHKRTSKDYDSAQCLITDDLFEFIQATQPKIWSKLVNKIHKGNVSEAKQQFCQKVAKDIKKRGTLFLLRDSKGFRLEGCKFKLIYFKPSNKLNPETERLYQANCFSVLRQFHYKPASPDKRNSGPSLDMGIFINGLPIFTVEIKNQLTGQTVNDAIRQYRQTRDPKEPLFAFSRCLAHFAIDNNDVCITTHLQGNKTRFLPFNQGNAGGAGNSPSAIGFATAYLWEQIWKKDSVLNLLQHFIHQIELENDKGGKTGIHRLIFPRYHQLDAVRRLVKDAYEQGTGQRYLIQHSAGSGKSNSIAWLAHQLSTLHNKDNDRVFNSIIIITDRRILDKQLQQTVRQFQQIEGVVENIDKTSRQLKEALEDGKHIIVTTLQKFPVIVNNIGELSGQRFAVIVDEAHSSQSGESRKTVHSVLTIGADEEKYPVTDIEEMLIKEASKRKMPPNVSFFAFTATPKPKTLELFGQKQSNGEYAPFSLYSMRQAIQEGFILDVLENYITYKTYWNLLKTISTDPKYDRKKATHLLRNFVESHKLAIDKKVKIIVEHLVSNVISEIKGKAKAMLVTRSRKQAVRYKLAIDSYIREKRYSFKTLVAFSSKLTVEEDGQEYTEANMNGFSDKQTAETFKQDEYRLLIVANKFQTGFDQPLLHTMYVDKKLNGVNAVQTLSRLNRIYPNKDSTTVLDFVNEADSVQKAFQPYYNCVILSERTDPNLLYDMESQLDAHYFYTNEQLDQFATLYLTATPQETSLPQLHAILDPVVNRFIDASVNDQDDFRKTLNDYVRLYAFLSQTARFEDADLEKLYLFGRFLSRKLPRTENELPLDIQKQIELESLQVTKTGSSNIKLKQRQTKLNPVKATDKLSLSIMDDKETLSIIIKELNTLYGFESSENEIITVHHIETRLNKNEALKESKKVNTLDNFRLSFDEMVKEKVNEIVEDNFILYRKIMDNHDFRKSLLDLLFERYLKQ